MPSCPQPTWNVEYRRVGPRRERLAGAFHDVGHSAGGPVELPARYREADPAALISLGVPQLLVCSAADEDLPVAQSRAHPAAARAAGDDVELVEIPGADHFDVVDTRHSAWQKVVQRLPALLDTA